ncbi:hypothetical protein [Runella sp. SP2]|uniref:hypothetical protein n=1 Tax=Runella sp. SP2 TaxID=2268026 RepID=UPI000F0860E4|nr:hypothetical protein [Runella sp. SP2]AYQ31464.1 hypothetical protein DTQ70_04370 [Runella sp. SP2]
MEKDIQRKYKTLKAKHELTDADIASWFGYTSPVAFTTSSAKKRITKGLVAFYEKVTKEEL